MAKAKMDEGRLASLLDTAITDSVAYDNSDLSGLRTKALEYFEGRLTDVPAQPNRSSVVSRDLSDTHSWIMPGLLRVFLGGEKVFCYEPRRPDAEEAAKQATDYVNYVFLAESDGYKVIHAALHDGLNFGNGLVKHWWDATPKYKTETFTGLADQAYYDLVGDDEVEVLEHSEYPDPSFTFASANPAAALIAAGPGLPGSGVPAGGGLGSAPANGAAGAAPGAPAAPAPAMGAPGAPPQGMGGQLPPQASPQPPQGPLGAPNGGAVQLGQAADPATGGLPVAAGAGAVPGGLGGMGGGGLPASASLAQGDFTGSALPLLHDIKIKRRISSGRLCIKALPPEEFLISRDATALTEEECGGFCAHYSRRTRSSLIEEGFDRDTVDSLPASSFGLDQDVERTAREGNTNRVGGPSGDARDRSTELVDVYECYVEVDYDGDGVAEWRKVVMAGDTSERNILTRGGVPANEEWGDDLPFTDLVPDPMPHRWRGRSLFEEVEEIQRVKTAMLRGALDSLYWVNNPQRWAIASQIKNPEELVSPTFNGTLWVDGPNSVGELPVPFIADKAFAGFEQMDKIREFRTGVSPSTIGLDAEAIQGQTATANANAQSASYGKLETMARNLAEVGMKRMGGCLLRLIVKHQDRERMIRLRGKWVEMDPKSWDAEMDVTVDTGLGTGSRQRDMMALQGIMQTQQMIIQAMGPNNPVSGIVEFRDAFAAAISSAGIKNPERFAKEVTEQQAQQFAQQAGQAKPDPAMMKAQADIAANQAKGQADMQIKTAQLAFQQQADEKKLAAEMQAKQAQQAIDAQHRREELAFSMQAKRDEAAMNAQLARERHAEEINLMREKNNNDIALAARKLDQEMSLKQQELSFEAQLKREQMMMQPAGPAATNIQEATP
jgi:hypothetical protein